MQQTSDTRAEARRAIDAESVSPAASFPIVGIGASAGGLEAISELLAHLPADSGMAFLVVQHLAPTHTSMLAEILAKKTVMAVKETIDGQSIEANHVYIIPPNTSMTVAQRHLTLQRRHDTFGPPTPIDDLFESLAQDVGRDAIGVILSGTGSDGTLGIHAIKGAGGVTFAQNEESARFSAMPRAAIERGYIDSVLAPRAIAEALAGIARHPLASRQPDSNVDPIFDDGKKPSDDESLKLIFRVLRNTCNIDFTHYKRGTVRRRLERRLVLHQMTALSDYVGLLQSNRGEALALCQDFLIHVTSFFRDAETYEDLTKIVWPRLLENRSPKTPLRIWVPGCASGEEVYSIAISLIEYLGERTDGMRIQIFGTDVSDAAIDTARAGRYIENIARDVSEERLRRFFIKINAQYQVAKPVRDLCIFSRHDVLRDPPFSRIDMLSCRNLLIYFALHAQKKVMPIFNYALSPGGFLTLGQAETVGTFSELFGVVDDSKSNIYVKKTVAGRAHVELSERHAVRPKGAPAAAEEAPLPAIGQMQQAADRIAQSRYVPAGVLCDEALNIVQFRGDTGPYLVQPPGPPSVNLQKLARPGLLIEIGSAIAQVRKDGGPVRRTGLRAEVAQGEREVSFEVVAVHAPGSAQPWFLIFFETTEVRSRAAAPRLTPWGSLRALLGAAPSRGESQAQARDKASDELSEIERLQRELEASRDYVRGMVEQHDSALEELKSAQEELLSSNEEYQSTNEELETAKEELQSANEELATTNDELSHRNHDLQELTSQLRQARDYAEAIVDTAREPMLVLDSNLRVVRANLNFYVCFKTTRELTERRLIYELGNAQWDTPKLRLLLEEILPEHTSFHDYEVTHVFPELGERTMSLNAQRLDWPEHALILLAIEDVTEREKVLETLRDVDRHKNEFLAMLGHELRNPLAAISNALQICERDDVNPAAKQQALAMIGRQLGKEIRLVDDLLDLSRITQGAVALEKKPVDLAQVVAQAVEERRHALDERRHELTLALPTEGSVLVEGDAMRLEQVVVNLLGNSIKFTDPGGRIHLAVEQHGREAQITVVDNGIGIAPELLPKIFDLFVQAKASPDRAHGGLGLGLTLVRRIIDMHGGTVDVKRRGLKQGAEFVVRLPALPQGTAHAAETKHEVPKRAPVEASRILVVDDSADTAESMAELLKLEGHEVATSHDGRSAIEVAQSFKPQVVLLDIGLPGMDGLEVARRLRKSPTTEAVLLIAISGYGQVEDRQRSVAAGFDEHLIKPADPARLNAIIAAHRGKRNGKTVTTD
jgi:two-component system CheB/CheR fusion protein